MKVIINQLLYINSLLLLLFLFMCCDQQPDVDQQKYHAHTVQYTGYNLSFLDSLNVLRSEYGAQPLTPERKLTELAKGHAKYMDSLNNISHEYFEARYIESQAVNFGETCAVNYTNVASEISAYSNSEGHFNVMIDNVYQYVGIAKVNGYQCVEFAKY